MSTWYPEATPEQVERFRDHGWLVVEDAIPGSRCGTSTGPTVACTSSTAATPWKIYVNQITGETTIPDRR
jgi:hypothetical protein